MPRQLLDLRIPALHAIVQIRRENADVDRLDNVLAEFLQPFVLLDLAAAASGRARVFDSDPHIAGKRQQQFDIDARKEIAVRRAADAQIGDGAAADRAGQVVGEVEIGDGAANRRRPALRNDVMQMARPFEEQIRLVPGGLKEA